MYLIIDIGNSQTKFHFQNETFFSLEEWLESLSSESKSKEEIRVLLLSVVPKKADLLLFELERRFKEQEAAPKSKFNYYLGSIEKFSTEQVFSNPEFLEERYGLAINNLYSTMGADRLAKAISAVKLKPKSDLILFDFGTCTTATALRYEMEKENSVSQYSLVGSFISLGFKSGLEALAEKAPELPNLAENFDQALLQVKTYASSLSEEKSSELEKISLSTKSTILEASYLAHRAMVRSWQEELRKIIPKAKCIASGGLAELFKEEFDKIYPDRELLEALFIKTLSIPA